MRGAWSGGPVGRILLPWASNPSWALMGCALMDPLGPHGPPGIQRIALKFINSIDSQ